MGTMPLHPFMQSSRSPVRPDPALRRQRGAASGALLRWLAPAIALVVLALVAWRAYDWLVATVAQEETRAGTIALANDRNDEGAQDRVAEPLRPVPSLPDNPDASLHQAVCAYLVAETARLGHEFAQPLPPPVLDRISTLLAQRRAQAGSAQCVLAAPKPVTPRPTVPRPAARSG